MLRRRQVYAKQAALKRGPSIEYVWINLAAPQQLKHALLHSACAFCAIHCLLIICFFRPKIVRVNLKNKVIYLIAKQITRFLAEREGLQSGSQGGNWILIFNEL